MRYNLLMAKGAARILFVEDDIGYQELAAAILSSQYELSICSNAEAAAAKLDRETFDLVISDINMFGMTGLELLNKMKREGKSETCPVILCSGQADPVTRETAMAQGAAGFIVKPYPIDVLKTLVAALLPKP